MFLVILNEKRARKDLLLPSSNEVLMRTGGSKRDVNRYMRKIRGILAEHVQPKRSGTTRTASVRSTTRGSELIVLGSDRWTTIGPTGKDLDGLRRTTARRRKVKRWKDPSK